MISHGVMTEEQNIPWEKRIEIAFWHGETGYGRPEAFGFDNYNYKIRERWTKATQKLEKEGISLGHHFSHPLSPVQIFEKVMESPTSWIRAYAVYWGLEHPEYLKAGFVDYNPDLSHFKKISQQKFD